METPALKDEIHKFFLNLQKVASFHHDYILIHKRTPRLYLISKKIYDEFKFNHKINLSIKDEYLRLKKWLYLPISNKFKGYEKEEAVISLRVSEDCNLACGYCYNKKNMLNKKNIKYMSPDIAKRAIDFFISKFNKKNICVVFYGGEPLLNFGTIKYILNYTRKAYKDRTFEFKLITNGTILNKEIINEIIKNDVKVMVSIDLPPSQHNRNRPFKDGTPSFKIINNNLKLLLKYIPFPNIILRTTISYDNRFTINDIISNFYRLRLPLDNFIIETEFGRRISYSRRCNLENQKKLLINEERNSLLNTDNKIIYKKEIIGNYLYTIISGEKSIRECIPLKNALTVNPIGEFYLCDVSVNKEEFYLGNIESGFEQNKIKKLKKEYLKYQNDCLNCWASSFCGKFCFFIRNNRDLLLKNCIRLKNEFIDELYFFLKLNYKQIKKLILSALYFTQDKNYINLQTSYLNLLMEIYKTLNHTNKYIRPINIIPFNQN